MSFIFLCVSPQEDKEPVQADLVFTAHEETEDATKVMQQDAKIEVDGQSLTLSKLEHD